MNIDEQRLWEELHPAEAQQLALVKQMEESQQKEEYKDKCLLFAEGVKGLNRQYPNDTEFGELVRSLLKIL